MLSATPTGRRWLTYILILGAALRLFPIWFGLDYPYSRPDENEAVGHALAILVGDLNPHFFHWPSLTFYIFAAAFAGVSALRKLLLADPTLTRDIAVLTARAIVAIAGTLTIVPVLRLARRAFGEDAALAAAFFLAVAVLHVRDSHFAMTDVLMTLFAMLSLARLVSALDDALAPAAVPPRLSGFAVAGLLGGLATSTKYNAAAVVVSMGVAPVILLWRSRSSLATAAVWLPLPVFAIAAAVGFVAGTPYSVLDAPAFSADFRYDLEHLSEAHGVDVGSGWYAHLARSLPYGCGWSVFLAAVAGLIVAWRRSPRHTAVLAAFVGAFLVVLGGGRTVFFRYVMPLVPLACVFAAVTATTLGRWIAGSGKVRPAAATVVVTLIVGVPSLASSLWLDVLLARTDTRVAASRWLKAQLRPEHSVYDAGGTYTRLDLHGVSYHQWVFDPHTQSFGDPDGRTPHWLVVPESPLRLYAQPDPGLVRLAAERYTPALVVRGTRTLDTEAMYDQQDAFFLPFSRFWDVERPGPTITVYRRKE
jgi:hypothetical protein